MLQSEFQERVGMEVTPSEYRHIEYIYNESDVSKDEFCKLWSKMNQERIKEAKQKAKERAAEARAMEVRCQIIDRMRDLECRLYDAPYSSRLHRADESLSRQDKSIVRKAGIEIGDRLLFEVAHDVVRYIRK